MAGRNVTANGVSLQATHDGVQWAVSELKSPTPSARVSTFPRQGGGTYSTSRKPTGRTHTIAGWIDGANDRQGVQIALDQLEALLSFEMFVLAQETATGWRHTRAYRVSELDILPSFGDVEWGWNAVLYSDSPYWWAGDGSPAGQSGSGWVTQTTGLASPGTGGLIFPITFPISFGGAGGSAGAVTVDNPGSVGRVTLRIDGPVFAPSVSWSNSRGTGVLSWPALNLSRGEFLTWDSVTRQSLLLGQSLRSPLGSHPVVAEGANSFTFGGSGSGLLTAGLLPGFGG